MKSLLLAFTNDTRGATSIEYAIIGALVSTVIVAGLLQIGPSIEAPLETVNSNFEQQ
jgi:Flp pilus assembly pilin Flp